MGQKQDIFNIMNGLVKFQRGKYNITSDAVWLAALPKKSKNVLDVGIGTGGVSLCILAHFPETKITGIDISEQMLSECANNIKLNERNIELINADIMDWKTNQTFDLVVTNPPYFKGSPAAHLAHHNVDLTKWMQKCLNRVKPMGYLCTIIDAVVLAEVIASLEPKCGDITIIPLFGSKNTAERVLVSARMGTNGGTKLFNGFSMNNDYILRDGLTIDNLLARI